MKIRNNKGITLIALVITIIVLLILAGVTISMVLGDDGIIAQAQSAKNAQEKGTGKDEGAISLAEGLISQYSMGKYDSSKNNGIATQNSTMNGQSASDSNPVIPKGFKAVDVGEAKWSEGAVDKGLVIEDGVGNQFVWVPVKDTANFTTLTKGYSNGSPQGFVGNEPDVVTEYPWVEVGADAKEENITAILDDGYENTVDGLEKQFQEEYKAMKKSVETYGGFYVGRYETGWDETNKVVVSKAGVPMTSAQELASVGWNCITFNEDRWEHESTTKATWYGLYAKQKELYKKNSSSSVVSGMIYGCQWDAIMNWMKSSSDSNVSSFVINSTGKGNYNSESAIDTGYVPEYAVNNIYDLAGNYWEWTQESTLNNFRILRGGIYSSSGYHYSASYRYSDYPPFYANSSFSSRLQLYIK